MRYLIAIFLLLLIPAAGQAEKRLALVIGNNAYTHVAALEKAVPDASAVSVTLNEQGFEVFTVLDAPRREMNRQIAAFTNQLQPGDTAFVFYAGHGVEIDGENYLLPTDILAPASGDRDFIKSESIALSNLLDRVRSTGARTTLAVIDACRNNPFRSVSGRSIGSTRGLGRITAPEGTFVIFSAGAGQLALDTLTPDDPNPNSVFTRTLLPYLSNPNLELRAMIAKVRVEVRALARTVNHEQFPAYYDELLGEFYFATTVPTPAIKPVTSPTGTSTTRATTRTTDRMRDDFELARSIGTPEALRTFVNTYHTRSDEFTYRMAVQLLEKSASTPDANAPELEPEATAPPALLQTNPNPDGQSDRRSLIQQTQIALNLAGCSAGGTDGVIGPRTRRAFARFLTESGVNLKPADLGSTIALRAVVAAGRGTCKTQATAPQIDDNAASGNGINLAGSWRYKATCALLLKVTGTIRYSRTGPNTFKGHLTDSLGQRATAKVVLNGRRLSSTLYFPTVTVTTRGTVAEDGNSYSDIGSTGCAATAWRTD